MTAPFTSAEGVTFTPWTDGVAVGFRVTREQDDRVEFVVLNPSSDMDGGGDRGDFTGRGCLFVYHGSGESNGGIDADPLGSSDPLVFVDLFTPDGVGASHGHRGTAGRGL